MQLRTRQGTLVDLSSAALAKHQNTLTVAPTGAGKTIMLAAVMESRGAEARVVLQHRDELVRQNEKGYRRFTKGRVDTATYTAQHKEWLANGTTFAMAQTLERNLDQIPFTDLLGIDEAHHCVSPSYLRIIDAFKKKNPKIEIYGTTATSERGDNKKLNAVFNNCADQIFIDELIREGHLVPPRSFVIDIGVQQQLSQVTRTAEDFDMSAVEAIMDKKVLNDRIVEEWKDKAGDRRTVVFCSTVAHANHVCSAFVEAGITAKTIHGKMSPGTRRAVLKEFDDGGFQVIVNVMVLTEGWDCQPVSCVMLLRPSSQKSTMIQMIGRGLRKVDPEIFPGIQKDDCLVLDFGTSLLQHGDILDEVNLGDGGTKDCPKCSSKMPSQCPSCAICGFEWPAEEARVKECPVCETENPIGAQQCQNQDCDHAFSEDDAPLELKDFVMSEIDILAASPFKYITMLGGRAKMAAAFTAWAIILEMGGRFIAVGGIDQPGLKKISLLSNSATYLLALQSADDHLLEHGDRAAARKTKRWMGLQPTDKQLSSLQLPKTMAFTMNRYEASCALTFKFNERQISSKALGCLNG